MLNRFKSLLGAPARKSSRIGRLIALEGGGRARWTPRDYGTLAREGYARNAIVYRAVRLIAESVGTLSFVLYEGAASATNIRCLNSCGDQLRARTAPRFWKTLRHTSCSRATHISRRLEWAVRAVHRFANFMRCGLTA